MKEILVKTLMTERVSCLQADATLQQVINQMVENRYSCMVITEGDSPLGIVTERDLVKVLHRGVKEINLELPVSDFMSSPVFCLNQNDSLFDALVVSKAERVRHFPVVDDKRALSVWSLNPTWPTHTSMSPNSRLK